MVVFCGSQAQALPQFVASYKTVSASNRQELFVILRDFSGLTQVLIPQEEVRMKTILRPQHNVWSHSYHKYERCYKSVNNSVKMSSTEKWGLVKKTSELAPLLFV